MSGPQDGPGAQGPENGESPGWGRAPDAPGDQPPMYPQYGQAESGTSPQYGQQPQYGQPPRWGQPPQYGSHPHLPYPQGPYPGHGGPPPGAYPGAPSSFPGGSPPPWGDQPPRRRPWVKWVVVASVLTLVLIAAVAVAGIVVQSREINDIDDTATGECITVSGTSDAATPHRANCSSTDFSFYVGQKVGENAQCADDYALHLTQRGKGRLCLTPNLREGKCYSLPGESGSVTDFAEVDCSATGLAVSKTVIKVQRRVESSAPDVCSTGEQLSYRRPQPVSYCADVLTSG